jgi:hypothetical protein
MRVNTLAVAASAARFLGIKDDARRVELAIERSSLESMRKLEKAEGDQWLSTKGTRPDMSFFRAAKTGEGKTVLPRESIELIEKAWGPLMRTLNYSVSIPEDSATLSPAGASS